MSSQQTPQILRHQVVVVSVYLVQMIRLMLQNSQKSIMKSQMILFWLKLKIRQMKLSKKMNQKLMVVLVEVCQYLELMIQLMLPSSQKTTIKSQTKQL